MVNCVGGKISIAQHGVLIAYRFGKNLSFPRIRSRTFEALSDKRYLLMVFAAGTTLHSLGLTNVRCPFSFLPLCCQHFVERCPIILPNTLPQVQVGFSSHVCMA